MDVEKEHEYWNMECEKLILVRSNKSTSQWAVKVRFSHSNTSRNTSGKWYTKTRQLYII